MTTEDRPVVVTPLHRSAHDPALCDATGARRRIHALSRMGWPQSLLAKRLGYTSPTIPWMRRHRTRISVRTADAVAALTDQLWETPGPSPLARARAKQRGWATMMAWEGIDIDDPNNTAQTDAVYVKVDGKRLLNLPGDGRLVDPDLLIDHAAVRRAMSGHPPDRLRHPDRRMAIEVMTLRGLGSIEISFLLRCPARSVVRTRAQLRREGRLPPEDDADVEIDPARYKGGIEEFTEVELPQKNMCAA